MTRRRKKQQAPEPCGPEGSEHAASGIVDRLASRAATQSGGSCSVRVVCGLLLLAVVAVFGQTARHDFVSFDDDLYVYENRHVQAGLTGEGIVWAVTQSHFSNWHPLTWLSLMADAHFLRPKQGPLDLARLAAGMHLVNVALHAANVLILFLVLRAMTATLWPSAFVAAVFAVHPLHVESVAWITERKDVLSGLFGLLALAAYTWYARGPSVIRYLIVAAALTLGMMAKSMLVTWPLVFLLLDYWPLQRRLSFRLILEKVPLLLLVAAFAAVTFLAHRGGGSVASLESVSISQRIARAAVLYVVYLGKSFWPVNLALYPAQGLESYWTAAGAGVLLALVTAGALWGARCGQRWLAVGWFWYLGALAPTIGLVQVGAQVMADRFLYLPQIGVCAAVAWGAAHAAGFWHSRRWVFAVVAALALAGLIACAWQQTSYWRGSEQLWSHALICDSNNGIAHDNLGRVLADRGEIDEAITHYRRALEIQPDHAGAHNNLGLALVRRGRIDEAISHYRRALAINPEFAGAANNLGIVLASRGEVDEAIAHYRRALEIQPELAEAHNNLGRALASRGQVDEAIAHYRQALEIRPELAEAHNNLGRALAGRGKVDEAIAHYRQALEIKSDYADAHNNLGLALAARGQVDEAVEHYRRALEIQPDFAEAHNNLALAEAHRGRFDEAIVHFQKTLEFMPDFADAHNNLGLALAHRGRIDEAMAKYRKVLGIEPKSAYTHANLGDALAGRGRLGEAVEHYQKAHDLAAVGGDTALADAMRPESGAASQPPPRARRHRI